MGRVKSGIGGPDGGEIMGNRWVELVEWMEMVEGGEVRINQIREGGFEK